MIQDRTEQAAQTAQTAQTEQTARTFDVAVIGGGINADLIAEDTQRAVTGFREARQAPGAAAAGHHHDQHQHQHQHNQREHHDHHDDAVMFTQEFWDERYLSAEKIWSGNANPHLVTTATDLAPATALDVGSGEGADAIWLAARGWQVTGIDVSEVALDRAAKRAGEAGEQIAERIAWQQADVLSWDPIPARFDLVSAQFMHLPRPALVALHRRLAAAVRPGGTLLIVGHHPSDLTTAMGHPDRAHLLFTAEQVAAELDPDDWRIVVAASPERQAVGPDGQSITLRDAVLRAVRRPRPTRR